MKKILFVCMGNICRSPMAEGIVREVFRQNKIEAFLDSAGTIDFHDGQAPDKRAQIELAKNGMSISKLKARKISSQDFENFDYIYAMDKSNYDFLIQMTTESQSKKIDMFMNISYPQMNISVPDPYYDNGFALNFEIIKKTAEVLAKKILQHKN